MEVLYKTKSSIIVQKKIPTITFIVAQHGTHKNDHNPIFIFLNEKLPTHTLKLTEVDEF